MAVVESLSLRLVADSLWKMVEPLIPGFRSSPPGWWDGADRGTGGVQRDRVRAHDWLRVTASASRFRGVTADRTPPIPGPGPRLGYGSTLHRAILDAHGAAGEIDWSAAIVDEASLRARKRGSLTGPNPVDHGKNGSKIHVLTNANGLPLGLGCRRRQRARQPSTQTARASHCGHPLPARTATTTTSGRTKAITANKGYDQDQLRTWLRERGITPRIARRGLESSERLARHRWKIERTNAWPGGYRRLTLRYERHGHLFAAFLTPAAALTRWKKPPT